MIKKIQTKFQSIKNKLINASEVYLDYILCITFLNLIISKVNQISFQISSIYLYLITIFLGILFIKQWFLITNKIKNTYLFNYLLYYFLILKNNIYGIIFEYFAYVEEEKYQRLIVFLSGFVLSSWSLNLLFLILNNSYNVSILLFIVLLFLNIFNLIEKKFIFTLENLKKFNDTIKAIDYFKNNKFYKFCNFFWRWINIQKEKKQFRLRGTQFFLTYFQFNISFLEDAEKAMLAQREKRVVKIIQYISAAENLKNGGIPYQDLLKI